MNMRTDTVLRNEGFQVLMEHMGLVEAERFIMLIQKEPFDYTEWQENLFEDMSIEEISRKATDYRQQQQKLLNRDKEQKRIVTFA
jgi:hypothetical protein